MKLALLLMPLLLAGCLATPVKRNFPDVPDDLKVSCPALREVDPKTTKLSEVVSVVSDNYGTYQECKIKVDGWVEWYNTQKGIFESVK
jgi:hypothetical protein